MSKVIIASFIVLVFLTMAAVPTNAATGKDYTKVFVIPLTVSEKAVTPGNVVLEYGYGPNLGLQSGTFRGELADTKGNNIISFTIWDPRIRFGDSVVKKPDGTVSKVTGILEKKENAEVTIVVPFFKNSGAFNLYDASGSRVSSVDLAPAIRKFCATNPGDPDCDAAAGSIPVLINGALVVFILAALAGWYLMKKRKPQGK